MSKLESGKKSINFGALKNQTKISKEMKTLDKLFLLIALTTLSNFSYAQNRDYVPMLNDGAKWIETMGATTFPPGPFEYNMARQGNISGDTLINGLVYHKIYLAGINILCQDSIYWQTYFFAMRENTEDQKVWIIEDGEMEEILYFDFSLGIGDTVPEGSYYSKDFFPLVVSSMDNITDYTGEERRRWQIEYGGSTVVEGIGSLNGVLTPYFPVSEYWEDLFCYTIDDSQIFPFTVPSDCLLPSDTCLTVGIPEHNHNSQNNNVLSVFPVPANDLVYIKFDDSITSLITLQIVDYTGRSVYSKVIENNSDESINVANWPAGIYFALIQEDGQLKGNCKLVVE